MRKRKAVIFDCDGTLVNSVPKSFQAVCKIFTDLGLPEPDFRDYFVKFHPPPIGYYQSRGVNLSGEEIWRRYLEHADQAAAELFPDTLETLARLSENSGRLGIVCFGVLSAQPIDSLHAVLERHNIWRFFHRVIGDANDKSVELQRLKLTLGIESDDILFVGDFPSDMRDGSRAGVVTIGVTQCMPNIPQHTLKELLHEAGANHCISSLSRLPGVLEQIL